MHEDRSDEGEGGDRSPATGRVSTPGRRRFLKAAGSTAGLLALAGCSGNGGGGTATPAPGTTSEGATPTGTVPEPRTYSEDELFKIEEWRGSGPLIEDRPDEYTGISMYDIPNPGGELTVYLGGGEGGLYENLLWQIESSYRDFTIDVRKAPSSQLANTIIEEARAGSSPADIFWAIDAGSIGIVAENDATVELPDRVVRSIPDTFHPTDQWVGTMGRARSIPYNTDEFSAEDIPNEVAAFPDDDRFQGAMGWAPTYGAFQSFITAMRLLDGEEATRQWLNGMQQQGISTYDNELVVANRVASGELTAGFSNHYYSRLVREERPDAPLELAFTKGDAGALINCSGAQIIRGSSNQEAAANLIHHLLSIEAQEFLGTRGYEYPLLPSVPPVGDIPRIEDLNPPDLNLAKLSDLEPTLQLLRDTGVL
ncbi:extracellular solute-binding protein [Halosimplex halobium]|uniref:extracellular solute-binding protein n=1 Tax=Halosimplex halobium TaxID=3396618 RepID=UPI003F573A4D